MSPAPLLLVLALGFGASKQPDPVRGTDPGPEAAPQDPAGPPAPSSVEGEWRTLNEIFLVVNEEVVTLGQFLREVRRSAAVVTTREDLDRLALTKRDEFQRVMLMTQAGRDLGFDPERIRDLVREDRTRLIERSGSVTAFGEQLSESRLSPEEFERDRENAYYGELWRAAVSGESQGAGGRPYVDAYIRPGRLLFEYRRQPVEQILPQTVQIQEIVLRILDDRSARETLALANELRDRVLAGEDFGKLAEQHSDAQQTRALGGRVRGHHRVDRMVEILPELTEFFVHGKEGDVCEPLPLRPEGELLGYQLLRLTAVERGGELPLTDLRIQEALRSRRAERLAELRVRRSLIELYEAAYVWPPPAPPPADTPAAP
jgi:hypothetical protein